MADLATRAVMEALGCSRDFYRLFWDDEKPHPDVCARHGNVWDETRDLCEVAEEAADAALEAERG